MKPYIPYFFILALLPLLFGFTDDEWVALLNKPTTTIIYVATNGNDQWSGKLPEPDSLKTVIKNNVHR